MRNFLTRAMATITGHPRYRPEDYELDKKLHWSKDLWISNIFRAYEYLFGRAYGVRCEVSASMHPINGKLHIQYEFHTLESLLVHVEGTIRSYLSYNFWQSFITNPDPIGLHRPIYLTLSILGLVFTIKTQHYLLPLFGLVIAYDNSNNGLQNPGTSLTMSLAVSGSNRFMLSGFINGGNAAATSVKYNNVSLTDTGEGPANPASGSIVVSFYMIAPDTGTNNLVYSIGSSQTIRGIVASYTGAKQSAQPDAKISSTAASGTSLTKSITTTVANCMVVAITSNNQGAASDGTNYTNRNNSAGLGIGDGLATAAGSFSQTINQGNDAGWAITQVSVAPAAALNTSNFLLFFK